MGDADTAAIQKLIKKVIELTRCSPSQAELALYDNDNNVEAAVDYIFDQGSQVESWTEQKNKKDKKKEEEERKPSRGQFPSRGRGAAVADRGGRGGAAARESRGGSQSATRGGAGAPEQRGGRGGGSSRGGRGQSRPQQPGRSQPDTGAVTKPADVSDESEAWKKGQLEFKRSENAAQAVASSSTSSTSTAQPPSNTSSNAPISFAAVAAAAARRDQQKAQPSQAPAAPVVEQPPRPATPEPTPAAATSASKEQDNFISEPSVAHPQVEREEETVPVNQEEAMNVVTASHNVQATSPQLQANVTWTSQLKNQLGIGGDVSAEVSPVKPHQQQQYTASPQLPGVEFASDPVNLADYHFGFEEASPVAAAPPPVEPVPHPTESLFSNARHSSATVAPLKSASEIHTATLGNGDYPLRTSSPPAPSQLAQSRLGFTDASNVAFNPTSQPLSKPLGQHMPAQPQSHQQQQHHQPQQQQQQQMFSSQMQFPSYANPYINMNMPNMYSPVTPNIRPEEAYSALLQYPFTMPGMEMANLMSTGVFPQTASNQSLTSQHRSDSHGLDNSMKFSSQTSRDQNQQPSAVQPPPGFGTSPFGMPQQMNMLHQQYNPQQYAHFMMPNIGSGGGRQIYGGQEDERKQQYDKMAGVKPQPPQQQQQQQYHNGGGHYSMGQAGKKYNWNS